jgi:homoserine O-acetyltransferase
VLGSCYGTTFETNVDKPLITIRDMVLAHQKLADFLNITSIDFLLGGSLGGMQCLEWSIINPDFIKNLFVIATNCKHSSWGIAFNEAQRMALELGEKGLDAARAIAMLSYRNYKTYEYSQVDHINAADDFSAASYQRYQGAKLRKRFTPEAYYSLSKSMDSNNVGRNRGSLEKALSKITAKTLIIGIDSDLLFPVSEQEYIARNIQNANYEQIKSKYGHDGFLLETDKIKTLLKNYFDFLN